MLFRSFLLLPVGLPDVDHLSRALNPGEDGPWLAQPPPHCCILEWIFWANHIVIIPSVFAPRWPPTCTITDRALYLVQMKLAFISSLCHPILPSPSQPPCSLTFSPHITFPFPPHLESSERSSNFLRQPCLCGSKTRSRFGQGLTDRPRL